MQLNFDEVQRQVERLLKRFSVASPPVPVEKIVRGLGILLCEFPAEDNVSGAIIRVQGKTVIAVNPKHHANRRRFTIAHELGHFHFHTNMAEHVDQDFRVSWRNEDSSKAVDWDEIRANAFAAELLMPTRLLVKDLNALKKISRRTVAVLALRYQVSPEAMKIRLTNIGIVPPYEPRS